MLKSPIFEKLNKAVIRHVSSDMGYIELVHSGEDYYLQMKKIIKNSQREIHLQTYIFENDETGNDIASCLKEAAQRKVNVYILLDAYGSSSLSDSFVQDLLQHGIFLRFFSPIFSLNNFYLGRRMHHKILVADGKIALIGGINIGNKYRGIGYSKPWLDYAVKLDCPAAEDLQKLCSDYFFKKKSSKRIKPVLHSFNNELVGIIQNDWLKYKTEVCDAYINALLNAKNEVIIAGSYFLPSKRLTKELKRAGKRGVNVKVILAGTSDIPLIRRATTHLYLSFLQCNIQIYEWNISVLHGKVAVVDNIWSTVGSFNLNNLSCYGSIEMNVEIYASSFAKILNSDLRHSITQCRQITLSSLEQKSSILNKLANWGSYQITRASMLLLTFLPHIRFLEKYR